MSAVETLVATPDPQPHTNLPAPAGCSCIFTASTGAFFGTRMQVHKVGDPDCPKHRVATAPISGIGQSVVVHLRDKLAALEDRLAATVTTRHKFA